MRATRPSSSSSFYIISTDEECDPEYFTNCVYEKVEYPIRVNAPVKGHFRVEGQIIIVVPDFYGASPMRLHREVEVCKSCTCCPMTYPAFLQPMQPLYLSLWNRRSATMATSDLSKCLTETSIKEKQRFHLFNRVLDTNVSKKVTENLLVSGIDGDQTFQRLCSCIVLASDDVCWSNVPAPCIHENTLYRVRVDHSVKGYLRVTSGRMEIVSDFGQASCLLLFKVQDGGDGSRLVLATTKEGEPFVLQNPEKDSIQQFFDLMRP
ncbi:hypothetical protein BGZ82_007978 [Podila clonocystis]|nr:hypothetical protein BGZ82_007978 [Podila clonocystis]